MIFGARILIGLRLFGSHDGLYQNLIPSRNVMTTEKLPMDRLGTLEATKLPTRVKNKDGNEHDNSVFHIQVFVLPIGIGGNCGGQNIGSKGDAYGFISGKTQKGYEHG